MINLKEHGSAFIPEGMSTLMEVGVTFKAVGVVTINRKAAAWLYPSKFGSRSFGLPCAPP
jgi:hypothetical protein